MHRLRSDARKAFARRISEGDASLRLYAILDAESCDRRGFDLLDVAAAWRDAGIRLVQYRDKTATVDTLQRRAKQIRQIFARESSAGREAFLILNDHPEIVEGAGFDGVHVGQGDMAPAAARRWIGESRILGISTHTKAEATAAAGTEVDSIAVGPVFGTLTKLDAEPIVGVEGVRLARLATKKPLVAIGGIDLERSKTVLEAGADSVAVISGLLPRVSNPEANGEGLRPAMEALEEVFRLAQDFLAHLK